MKRRHAIPLPRKRAREKGRAGVDRPPLRLYRTEPKYRPRHAIWVGAGSEFANPFAVGSDRFDSGIMRGIVEQAARCVRGLKPEVCGLLNKFDPPPVTDDERAKALAWLYREWRAGRLSELPQSVVYYLDRLRPPLPAPPSDDAIRAALAGRDLVDSTPDRWPSHADELLRVANAEVSNA